MTRRLLRLSAALGTMAVFALSSAIAFAAGPTANDDSAAGSDGTAITISVFGNDTDPDGDLFPGTSTVTSGPANGTAVWIGRFGNGRKLLYTSNAGFTGVDVLTYRVCDLTFPIPLCDSATVTISINGGTTTTTTSTTTTTTTLLPPPRRLRLLPPRRQPPLRRSPVQRLRRFPDRRHPRTHRFPRVQRHHRQRARPATAAPATLAAGGTTSVGSVTSTTLQNATTGTDPDAGSSGSLPDVTDPGSRHRRRGSLIPQQPPRLRPLRRLGRCPGSGPRRRHSLQCLLLSPSGPADAEQSSGSTIPPSEASSARNTVSSRFSCYPSNRSAAKRWWTVTR